MTGSPVFKFNANLTKKHKIQRKLNFVRDVPRNPLRLHIDNLLAESEKNSDSQDEKEAQKQKPSKSLSSLSSFVFENKKGVKRKLDFEADDVSDEVSSFKFSNQNISLNGFHSRNSSLGDIKSMTISPSKNRYRRSSCTRSSIASTCRRRLFTDAEPEAKKAKLESPILCPRPKRKEIKLSLQKRFPGVPNSDAARSGLLLNLAFSKYNMLNNGKEENVSVDFVDQKCAKNSSKKELLQYSSIKKDTASFHYSPVFKAIKKVKRKLNLEEQDSANQMTTETLNDETLDQVVVNPSSDTVRMDTGLIVPETSVKIDCQISDNIPESKVVENHLEKSTEPVALSSPMSVRTHKSATKYKGDLFKNSRLRPSLRNEIFNLSKPDLEDNGGSLSSFRVSNYQQTRKRSSFCSPRHALAQRNSLGCVKIKPKYDRIIINKDVGEDKNSSRTDGGSTSYVSKNSESAASRSAKRWFDDSFYRGKRSDLRKSLFHRRHEAFLDSHIQRFLNDCAQAAELGVSDELPDSQTSCEVKESEKIIPSCQVNNDADPINIIEDVESPVCPKRNKVDACIGQISTTETQTEIATHRSETSPVIQFKTRASVSNSSSKKPKHCQEVTESVLQPNEPVVMGKDFVIEDINSQEINKHCVEEVELFIENAESQDCFPSFTKVAGHLPDDYSKKMSHFSVLDVTADDNISKQVSVEKESVNDCSKLPNSVDPDLQVEEVSSSESVSEEPYFTLPVAENSTPNRDTLDSRNDVTFDSAKKRKRKKCYSDDLVSRLERLICREKSDVRMWEYEMSKKTKNQYDHNSEPAVFRVQKMWKEFSRLILLCTLAKQDTPDKSFDVEIKNFGVDVTNSVILMMESSMCPKGLTYSSVFRIHPPWNILSLEKYDCVIILRPCRIEIISRDNEPPDARNLALPDLLEERQFCSCAEACNCSLPEGYQTVMQPLLYSSSHSVNFKSYRWKNYDEEYFKLTRSVNKVVLKHKLFSREHLFLKLCVLHVQRKLICEGCILWYMLCVDEEEEVCCVVMEDEMRATFPIVERNEFLQFSGILPWKLIPAKSRTIPTNFGADWLYSTFGGGDFVEFSAD